MQKTSERYLHKIIFSSYHDPHSGSKKGKVTPVQAVEALRVARG
jgi:hypothetical protein